MKKRWGVRVVFPATHSPKDRMAMLVEWLRYAGIVGDVQDNENELAFVMRSPDGVDSFTWATMNADRIKSFGVSATAIMQRH